MDDHEKELLLENDKVPDLKPASFKTLFRFASRRDIVLLIVAFIATLIFSAAPILLAFRIGRIIEIMDDYDGDYQEFYESERDLWILNIILGGLTIVFSWIAIALFIKAGNNQAIAWKKAYFSAIISKQIEWFEKNNPAELSSKIDMDCNIIEHSLGEKTMFLIHTLVLFFASWVVCFILNYYLTLISLLILPVQLFAAYVIQKATTVSTTISQENYKTAGGIAEESLEGIKTVASCNAQSIRAKHYQKELEPLKRLTTLVGVANGIGWGIFFFVLFAFSGLLLFFGAYLMVDNPVVLGHKVETYPSYIVIIFFGTAITSFFLGAAVPCIQYIQEGRIVAGAINDFINNTEKFDGCTLAVNLKGHIEFENVNFSYATNKASVLKGVSFNVQPGESLAIVGETGCGKSTIIQLIEGFYYPNKGRVLIDGTDITTYDLKSLREFIGLVSQEPILFNCSIYENVSIGANNPSESDVYAALKEAEADIFIDSLPDKYETWAGIKGTQLSGGQKQRIAIARALIKKPVILLLDEATSALDSVTEKRIQETLDKILENRTTIIVAQRLTTIKNVQRIIVLDDGIVSESGSFESLAKTNGKFSNLLSIQIADKQLDDVETVKDKADTSEVASLEEALEISNKDAYFKIIGFMKRYWVMLTISILAAASAGFMFPLFGLCFGDNINSLIGLKGDRISDTKANMFLLLTFGGVVFISIFLLCASLSRISAEFAYKIRFDTLNAILHYDQEFFDKKISLPATLASRLAIDCDMISRVGGPSLGLLLFAFSSLTLGIIISMQFNVIMSLVVVAIVPFFILSNLKGELLVMNGLSQNNLQQTTEIASDALSNIKTVHSLNKQEHFTEKYIKATLDESSYVMDSAHNSGFYFGFRYSVIYLCWGSIAWIGAYLVKERELDIDDMNLTIYCIIFSNWGFIVLGALVPDVGGGIQGAKRIFKLIDYRPRIVSDTDSGLTTNLSGLVEFCNVSFQYPNRDIMVLNNLSFQVSSGQRLGITGTTGSGKSTIGQLLIRLYDPSDGEILIGGMRIKEININHLRKCVAWVGQEPILFKGGILFNLQLAEPELDETGAMVALDTAQASDIVEKYGMFSDVGLRGSMLSGGQKQRVAIARALVRKPSILILDEATSALDNLTESALLNALAEKEFTLISIAHKIRTIQSCNKIILLEAGALLESGTHEELINISDGLYRKLYYS